MKKINTLLSITFLLTLSLTAKADDKCSVIQNNKNNASAAVQNNSKRVNEVGSVWISFCSVFKIHDECMGILSAMSQSPDVYGAKALPLLKKAARNGYMNSREIKALYDMAETLYSLNASEAPLKKTLADLSAKLVSTKCDKALNFIAMTDTALISKATQKEAIGHCQIVPLKNSDKYSILISDVAYPIVGASYSNLSEMAVALREAIDAGLCQL